MLTLHLAAGEEVKQVMTHSGRRCVGLWDGDDGAGEWTPGLDDIIGLTYIMCVCVFV